MATKYARTSIEILRQSSCTKYESCDLEFYDIEVIRNWNIELNEMGTM